MDALNPAFRISGEIFSERSRPRYHRRESVVEHLLEHRDVDDLSSLFVCYSHEDAPLVLPWVRGLIRSGLVVRYDEGGVLGARWFRRLSGDIDRCSGMLFIMSPRSVASRNCQLELQYAISNGKPVAFADLKLLRKESGHDDQTVGSAQSTDLRGDFRDRAGSDHDRESLLEPCW